MMSEIVARIERAPRGASGAVGVTPFIGVGTPGFRSQGESGGASLRDEAAYLVARDARMPAIMRAREAGWRRACCAAVQIGETGWTMSRIGTGVKAWGRGTQRCASLDLSVFARGHDGRP